MSDGRRSLHDAFLHLRDALGWRLRGLIGDRAVDRIVIARARRWRPKLRKPVFIGVTGSAGKTTTKELLLGMLSHKGRGVANRGSYSNVDMIAEAILRSRKSHDFFVTELSGHRANEMDENLPLVRPSIGIVTLVSDDHSSASYPRDAIAREKGKLIASLPASGTAVLNADDEVVRAMAARSVAKVLTYGLSPDAELRAEDVSSAWPDRLQLTLVRGNERVRLKTQLCGTHWIPSVLGAVGGGLAFGLTLPECAEGIAATAPFEGRMQPVSMPSGVTFIRDDFKAPLWTIDACFDFMHAAQAKRKIIVIGMLSDAGSEKGAKYAKIATEAQEIADLVVFVGPWASSALKTRRPGREHALRAFGHVRDAAAFVNSVARDGDLVLLKGTNRQDHLLRVVLAATAGVACWRDDCDKVLFCDVCNERTKASGPPYSAVASLTETSAVAAPIAQHGVEAPTAVIIGLGNPEPKYEGTPHNVGYAVTDRLAATLGLGWQETPSAWIARGAARGRDVCLVKLRSPMNGTGAELKRLAETYRLNPAQCTLVHDDLALPLGTVRTRLSGGAGGHRGVASILEAFQTDAFRRLKIGVDQAEAKSNRLDYVLTPFPAASSAAVDKAILVGEARLLEWIGGATKAP